MGEPFRIVPVKREFPKPPSIEPIAEGIYNTPTTELLGTVPAEDVFELSHQHIPYVHCLPYPFPDSEIAGRFVRYARAHGTGKWVAVDYSRLLYDIADTVSHYWDQPENFENSFSYQGYVFADRTARASLRSQHPLLGRLPLADIFFDGDYEKGIQLALEDLKKPQDPLRDYRLGDHIPKMCLEGYLEVTPYHGDYILSPTQKYVQMLMDR